MLAVSDTGCGMDAETQSHIFEPFFTTKEKSKGTGLGLSTVYGIVKQSGGYIWAYSEPGQGTIIKIYFPRVEESVGREKQGKAPAKISWGTGTILVVEDEEPLRELTCDLLKSTGYKVLKAGNGAEGLEVARRYPEPIHLLLTDVVMPKMKGPEMAQQIKHSRPDVKVLYISGYHDENMTAGALLDENAAFLEKPYTREVLTHKLRDLLKEKEGSGGQAKKMPLPAAEEPRWKAR